MTTTDRCKNMILGALVADAAAMGLHWIYDQARIQAVAPQAPEFLDPDPKHYDGVPAFFAHPNRAAGDSSQYGEQAMVMLRTLVASNGKYENAEFAAQFRQHFGYGGAYVGYIDHATRDTLDNMRRFEDAALERAYSLPFKGEAKTVKSLLAKLLPLMARHSGEALKSAFHDALPKEDEMVSAFADQLLIAVTALPKPTGATDLQLPAIAKLPALVALYAAQGIADGPSFNEAISSAVRVTSDHPIAAEYGKICAHMMATALSHGTASEAISAARSVAGPEASALLDEALSMKSTSNTAATKHFGMACDLPFGVPSATHNIATATSFTDAVRQNIYSGGDSCGRAILVGAVMGAIHGVGGEHGIPNEWIDKMPAKENVQQILNTMFEES